LKLFTFNPISRSIASFLPGESKANKNENLWRENLTLFLMFSKKRLDELEGREIFN